MDKKIYLGEYNGTLSNNPLEDTNYLNILGLLPTLGTEIKKRVLDLLSQTYQPLSKTSLHHNYLAPDYILENAKKELIDVLYSLEKLTQISKNIVFFGDDCFTNILLERLLGKILGDKNFERFVEMRPLDFSKPCDETTFKIHQNSLAIFGGSLWDTDTIHESYYSGYFAELIKNLGDDFDPLWLNNRIIGVCFGQQYIANLLGITNHHTSSVIATYRGMAQFGPSNCSLENYKYINPLHQQVLYGLSNFGLNHNFSTFFTRTGYVDFDLLKTGYSNLVVPLIKDQMTGSIVGWGTKNGNILGVQFHPEISFFENRSFLEQNIAEILPYLSQYKHYEKLYGNFNFDSGFGDIIERDIGEYFYTFSLLAYLRSIKERYETLYLNGAPCRVSKSTLNYREALSTITKVVREKIDNILAISNPEFNDQSERLSFLKKIDESGRLLLNSRLDWKVNRGLEEVSKVLGFQDIGQVLQSHIDFIKQDIGAQKAYFFRDWGAGDGSLLKDLYSLHKGKDILFYGVGDYVYFDIYPSLKKKGNELNIPEEVIILLFEEFLSHYNTFEEGNIYNKVVKALTRTHLDHIHTIHISSITGTDTAMFSSEGEHEVSKASIQYIASHKADINLLKQYIIENFYSLFEGYFERIYVSKFNDFDIRESSISKVDFQVSIRATSHVDSREYMKIILDYIEKSANPGSLYIDNGVHRSYTGVPRIYEIQEVSTFLVDTKISLIYDTHTNYFPAAVFEKKPFHKNDFISSQLREGYKVVSLEEACESTFFKLEYFIRNFIVRNFKNYDVFWDFNREIIETLVKIIDDIKAGNMEDVKYVILDLINYIATHYKNGNIVYDLIDMEVLEKYSVGGETLKQIISAPVYIPDWMNLDAKRRY